MTCTPDTIRFERIINFRDLGGHPTVDGARIRTGSVFRSATLSHASPQDLLNLRFLGIRSVLDLRTTAELDSHGSADVARIGAELHHVPVLTEVWDGAAFDLGIDPVQFLSARYDEILELNGGTLVKAVLAIVDTRGPVLLHCTAGKDRTGVLAALILASAGVPDPIVADDYARSDATMPDLIALFDAHVPAMAAAVAGQPPAFLAAPREAMLRTLTSIRWDHGDAANYLVSNGLPLTALSALRRRLLGRI